VKFGRPEVCEIARCLPDKKKQKIGKRSRSRGYADRAKNLSDPASDSVLGVPQISSKSLHFRRNYSRTRERHIHKLHPFPEKKSAWALPIFCTVEHPFNAAALSDGHGHEMPWNWGMNGQTYGLFTILGV